MSQQNSNWLTLHQLATRWGISYETIRREVLAGKLPSLKVRRVYRISLEVIERIERRAKSPAENTRAKARSDRRKSALAGCTVDYFPSV